MRRKSKAGKEQASHIMTPETLLNDMNAEVLARKLDERALLHIWLVFRIPTGTLIIMPHSDANVESIQSAFAEGGEPIGYALLEKVKEDDGTITGQWFLKPNAHYEGALKLLERVQDDLIKRHCKPEDEP